MRTKALILSAMLGVAGISSSVAQNVYSVNVVGYINLTLTNNFNLIANQLDNGAGNLVTNMFTGLPAQTVIYKFNGSTYTSLTYLGAPGWNPPAARQMTCAPGEGVFVKRPAGNTSPINLTFVGEVMQGDLVNPVALGFDIYSAMVPQQGGITAVHNYQPANQDVVYKFNGVSYSSKTWLQALNRWNPAGEPVLEVGEAIFINSKSIKNWTRTFNVN
jgi:hypothetical protein